MAMTGRGNVKKRKAAIMPTIATMSVAELVSNLREQGIDASFGLSRIDKDKKEEPVTGPKMANQVPPGSRQAANSEVKTSTRLDMAESSFDDVYEALNNCEDLIDRLCGLDAPKVVGSGSGPVSPCLSHYLNDLPPRLTSLAARIRDVTRKVIENLI